MKTKITTCVVLAITFAAFLVASELPREAQAVLDKRHEAVDRLEEKFKQELEVIRERCEKDGDLKTAKAVQEFLENRAEPAPKGDPFVNSTWHFLGVKRQRINEFRLLASGKVECKDRYEDATWRRIDKDNILFSYGIDRSYIVFRATDSTGRRMSGYHHTGRARYLQRIR